MPQNSLITEFLETLRRETRMQTWSLILSLYGDAITPRGGWLSTSSLIEIMAHFNCEANGVRTSLSRLVANDLFERQKLGRESAHGFSEEGNDELVSATNKIYSNLEKNGQIKLIMSAKPNKKLMKIASRDAYGSLTNSIYITNITQNTRYIECEVSEIKGDFSEIIAKAWDWKRINNGYLRLIEMLKPLNSLRGDEQISPQDALVLRVLLIHAYRRVVLHDPRLPSNFLSSDYKGEEARSHISRLYHTVLAASEAELEEKARFFDTPLPSPSLLLQQRFLA